MTHAALQKRYLDLLESALTGVLYEDVPFDPWHGRAVDSEGNPIVFEHVPGTDRKTAKPFVGVPTIGPGDYNAQAREYGLDWPLHAPTMVGVRRLHNARELAEDVVARRVPGDFMETGVWRGGVCILLRGVLAAHGDTVRRVFVADSFQGLPPASQAADAGDAHHTVPVLAVSLAEVQANFRRFGLLDEQIFFVAGWFRDSLPLARRYIDKLALLRLDGDMYEATNDALVNLYDKLSPGGFLIVDDFHSVPGCKKAVLDFRAAHGIDEPLVEIDGVGVYWRRRA